MNLWRILPFTLMLSGCWQHGQQQDLERFIVQTYAAAKVTATPLLLNRRISRWRSHRTLTPILLCCR